ncbi:sugar phosphate isomerase/epimerase family protein [Clostridium polynesiense]|uniref:sugar phosphate isomerase/epimerase family protein n=1 Tax=Clostridium polynesiense TaxID=1325933 RepID=UPI00059094DE|nr:TIM barrel protein [Clostridium polynesiense]
MNIYASHLIKTEEMQDILKEYKVNLEIVNFGSAMILDDCDHYLKEYKRDMEGFLDNREITIHGPFIDMSPGSPDKYVRKVTMERFQQSYEAAKSLNAGRMIFHSGFIPKVSYGEEWLENSKVFWEEFIKDKIDSMKFHIENVFDDDYRLIKELIEYINHPNFTACFDIGHANAASKNTIKHWIEGLEDKIDYVHLHNNDGSFDYHNSLLEGSIDMSVTLELLKAKATKASWCLEVFNTKGIIESLKLLKKLGYLK